MTIAEEIKHLVSVVKCSAKVCGSLLATSEDEAMLIDAERRLFDAIEDIEDMVTRLVRTLELQQTSYERELEIERGESPTHQQILRDASE